jgi:hypothetical protein
MEKMGFAISDKEFLVMPKYPIEPIFYQTYNAMLYVNEPSAYCDSNRNCEKMSDADPVLNKHLKAVGNQHLKSNQECNVNPQGNQQCKINVLAYTNFKWKTIDYIAATDIVKNSELLVYYGNQYNRSSYNIIK